MPEARPNGPDKLLFTPGPLTTSDAVKEAMLHDYGSRDAAFLAVVAEIRSRLLQIAGVATPSYEAILLQGSGTYAVEAVFSSALPPRGGKVLVVANGAYGHRMAAICGVLNIPVHLMACPESLAPTADQVRNALREDSGISHVAVVHCETTTGIMNPVEEMGAVAREAGKIYIVDAMSSFGAVPLSMENACIDYLISSANKCIEGVPGFAFVLARRAALLETKGWARSLCLDLFAQWQGLEANGQFRFTPPTHALLAFHRALIELEAEGGVEGRARRYRNSHRVLVERMAALGFNAFLPGQRQGHIITSFLFPRHENWSFETFYERLSERGFLIYPGKVSDADCFRIGNIGRIEESDVLSLMEAVEQVLPEMGVDIAELKGAFQCR